MIILTVWSDVGRPVSMPRGWLMRNVWFGLILGGAGPGVLGNELGEREREHRKIANSRPVKNSSIPDELLM